METGWTNFSMSLSCIFLLVNLVQIFFLDFRSRYTIRQFLVVNDDFWDYIDTSYMVERIQNGGNIN